MVRWRRPVALRSEEWVVLTNSLVDERQLVKKKEWRGIKDKTVCPKTKKGRDI